jgi:hypothetical protein
MGSWKKYFIRMIRCVLSLISASLDCPNDRTRSSKRPGRFSAGCMSATYTKLLKTNIFHGTSESFGRTASHLKFLLRPLSKLYVRARKTKLARYYFGRRILSSTSLVCISGCGIEETHWILLNSTANVIATVCNLFYIDPRGIE